MTKDRGDKRGVVIHPFDGDAEVQPVEPIEILLIGAVRQGTQLEVVAEYPPWMDFLRPQDRFDILADALEAFSLLVAEERAALPAARNSVRPIGGDDDAAA